jgi:hypothetical protein
MHLLDNFVIDFRLMHENEYHTKTHSCVVNYWSIQTAYQM